MPNLDSLSTLHEAGWNWYQDPTRARADDALARAHAADRLAQALARVTAAEAEARRAIPAPTREAPLPDPALLAAARSLKTLAARIAAIESRLRGQAAPPDRDGTRLSLSPEACAALVDADAALLSAAEDCATAPLLALPASLDALEQALASRATLTAWR